MARILFVHPNFPGQFMWLARHLASLRSHDIKALRAASAASPAAGDIAGIDTHHYGAEVVIDRPPQHLLNHTETFIRNAASLALKADALKQAGFYPDIVYTHSGWGVGAFLHNVFPAAKQVKYCEWYYNRPATGVRFLRRDQLVERIIADDLLNLPLMAELAHFDRLIAPTQWQREQFPEPFRDRIAVIPDGLDPELFTPTKDPQFRLDDGRILSASDKIVTYVARGADMFRGFETFLQALSLLQSTDPSVHCLIAGDTKAYYGPGHGTEEHFREVMQKTELDHTRVHFLGTIQRDRFVSLLRVSSVHVYLTVPFVLSWSLLEAMAAGCVVVASDTPPVAEFITDGANGHLVDFFDAPALSQKIGRSLNPAKPETRLRQRARETARERWSVETALQQHMLLLQGLQAPAAPDQPA